MFARHAGLLLTCLALLAGSARADEPALASGSEAQRTLSTAGSEMNPHFAFWRGEEGFIKPVLQLGSMVVGFFPSSDQNKDLAPRVSTLALARFGLEGELFDFVRFRSVFERNFGFSLARNGPVGTSVWEGTASLQARENYIQLYACGFSVTGGIFRDPASVDFISDNVLDSFGMDPYVRDPLLVSGYSQGQGVMLRYTTHGLTAGLSFTAGNPLTTSLAFGFGGDVSSLGTLFTAPLRALSNGVPGSDIQLTVLAPSLSYSHELFDVRLQGQFYIADVDVTQDTDKALSGFNARLTARVKLLDDTLRVFVSGAFRRNQQLAIPDLTTRTDAYEGVVFGAGFDLGFDRLGVGAQYYYLHSELTSASNLTNHYLNVGATWWLEPGFVSLGLRWARTMAESEPNEPRLKRTDSVILSMRLII